MFRDCKKEQELVSLGQQTKKKREQTRRQEKKDKHVLLAGFTLALRRTK